MAFLGHTHKQEGPVYINGALVLQAKRWGEVVAQVSVIIEYKIDLTKPVGKRIIDLKFKGKTFLEDQKIIICLNNFRYYGGGGYNMFKGSKILSKSSKEIRQLIIDYVMDKKVIPGDVNNNWQIIPN